MASSGHSCCAAAFCRKYKQKYSKLSFFRFPKDPERCSEWITFSERTELLHKTPKELNRSYQLCSEHFEEKYFMNSSRQKLVWNAIPKLKTRSSLDKSELNEVLKEKDMNLLPSCSDSNVITTTTVVTMDNEMNPMSLNTDDADENHTTKKRTLIDIEDENKMENRKRRQFQLLPSNPSPRTRRRLYSQRRLINKYKNRYFHLKKLRIKKCKVSLHRQLQNIPGLSKTALSFISCQIELAQLQNHANRYSEQMKSLALDIYFHSAKCYRMLSKIFRLPTIRSLQNWLKNIDISPGFSQTILQCIPSKIDCLDEKNKLCILSFDEMSLKHHLSYNVSQDVVVGFQNYGDETSDDYAGYALVFMLRGLTQNWKLPIGYFFSGKGTPGLKLKQLLLESIKLINETGLKLKAVVCDQGCHNQSLFKLLQITLKTPYIMNNDEKIHFLFDVPHLIKNIRNNFHKYGFSVGENKIYWKYIVDIYEKDKKQNIRAMHKLTDRHIYLPPFSKMKVKLATQVLSNTVASIMCTHIACNTLPQHAYHTAEFILMFDKIFDSLNSSSFKAKNEYLSAISDQSIHEEFFPECINFLNNCVVNSQKQPPCLLGLKLTITSVINLWHDLKTNCNISYLRTRRLNQDALENFFAVIRQKSGCNINPTCTQFEMSMRHLYVGNLFKLSEKTSNCEQDLDKLLKHLTKTTGTVKYNFATKSTVLDDIDSNSQLNVPNDDFNVIAENAFHYVAGWMAKKLQDLHVCNICHFVKHDATLEEQKQLFTSFMAKEQTLADFGKLTVPSNAFYLFIKNCENVFVDYSNTLHEKGIGKKLFDIMSSLDSSKLNLCSVSTKNIIISYFIKIRIFWLLKFQNRKILETRSNHLKIFQHK